MQCPYAMTSKLGDGVQSTLDHPKIGSTDINDRCCIRLDRVGRQFGERRHIVFLRHDYVLTS